MLQKLTAGLGTVTVVAAAAVALTATPAHAVLVSTDPAKVTEPHLDFGAPPFILGAPSNSGVLGWDLTAGLVSPILSGTLFINNASGTCARMRLEAYDANHVLVDDRNGGTVCASSGALHQWTVYFAVPGDAATTHAHIVLQEETSPGNYTDRGTDYADY
jgi:hypothetical protein